MYMSVSVSGRFVPDGGHGNRTYGTSTGTPDWRTFFVFGRCSSRRSYAHDTGNCRIASRSSRFLEYHRARRFEFSNKSRAIVALESGRESHSLKCANRQRSTTINNKICPRRYVTFVCASSCHRTAGDNPASNSASACCVFRGESGDQCIDSCRGIYFAVAECGYGATYEEAEGARLWGLREVDKCGWTFRSRYFRSVIAWDGVRVVLKVAWVELPRLYNSL
jgi:hypothetical protein